MTTLAAALTRRSPRGRWLRLGAGALLLLTSGVHLYLYAAEAYRYIPTIGPLFLMTGLVAVVLALALPLVDRPLLDLLAAGFEVATLGAYVLTLELPKGLFLFEEPGVSYSGGLAIFSEVGAAALLLAAALPPLLRALQGRPGQR
ncbi:hypothetical protein [Aciditerrimonas ferrireducens]|uniref:hypothetical protein n=1 Tax=Aciditerrimonas ferrireducens TaxID=667306 RepID=UPI002002BB1D|nr:hypothetical protein [Aciditerrimonas ferrireducens]MCK4178093.1 hypothetical protein [Aciditerrimonas ferrireducens]